MLPVSQLHGFAFSQVRLFSEEAVIMKNIFTQSQLKLEDFPIRLQNQIFCGEIEIGNCSDSGKYTIPLHKSCNVGQNLQICFQSFRPIMRIHKSYGFTFISGPWLIVFQWLFSFPPPPTINFLWKVSENLITKRHEYKPERFKFKFILRVIV